MNQFEETKIAQEIIQYLNMLIQTLEDVPAFYPSSVSVDQLSQTMLVEEYRHLVPTRPQQRGSQEIGPAEAYDFARQWITRVPLWQEGIEERQINDNDFLSIQKEWTALRHSLKRVVLLGHPGSGKSWLLRMEGLRVAREQRALLQSGQGRFDEFVFPLFMPMAVLTEELLQGNENIYDALAQKVQRDYTLSEPFQQWLKQWLMTHPSLLLLDGLEEVAEPHYSMVSNALQQLANQRRCHIFLTSRIWGYRGTPFRLAYNVQEKELGLLPFSRKQVHDYIAAWYTSNPQSATILQEIVQKEETVYPLICQPFLLSFYCLISDGKQTPPLTRVSLYEALLQTFSRQAFPEAQGSHEHTDAFMEVLELIAWQSVSQTEPWPIALLEQDVLAIIPSAQKQRNQTFVGETFLIFENVVAKRCILERSEVFDRFTGTKRWVYRFPHSSFAHYLVARYLVHEQNENWLMLVQRIVEMDNADWEEVLVFLAGCLPDAEPLFAILIENMERNAEMALLAGRCLVEADRSKLPPAQIQQIVIRLRVVSFSVLHQQRKQIGMLLVQFYDAAAIDKLRTILWDSKRTLSTKCAVIWALGALGKISVAEDVELALWENDRDEYGTVTDIHYLRCVAAWTIGRLYDWQATELIQVVEEAETHDHLLCAATWALGQLKAPEAIQIFPTLLYHKNIYVRVSALWSLGEVGTLSDFDTFFALMTDKDVSMRIEAQEALTKLDRIAIPELLKKLEMPELSIELRIDIVNILGALGDNRALRHLLLTLHEENSRLRMCVIRALRQIGDRFASDELLARLWDKNEEKDVRMEAARALASFDDPRLVPALLDYVQDHKRYSLFSTEIFRLLTRASDQATVSFLLSRLQRQEIAVCNLVGNVLGGVADERISKDLLAIIQNKENHALIRASAVNALQKIEKGNQFLSIWLDLLHDVNWEVRNKAVQALEKFEKQEVLEPLLALLHDTNTVVRSRVIETLGKFGDPKAIPMLGEIVQRSDEDFGLVSDAVKALGNIGGERIIGIVRPILMDSNRNHFVVNQAINAIKKLGLPSNVPIFVEALQAKDEFTRWKAAEALGEIGDERAVDGLLGTLTDEKKNVRGASVKALGQIGHPRSIPGVSALIHDSDRQVSQASLVTLGQIKSPEAKNELYIALEHGSEAVQETAALVLARLGDRRSVKKLLTIIQDNDGARELHVRVGAIRALCGLGEPEAVKSLLTLLWNNDEVVRGETASRLLDLDVSLLAHFLSEFIIPGAL